MDRHFAALTLPDSGSSEAKLSRAISFSELPTTRRILVEQCYRSGCENDSGNGSETLLRQYSCEQIFDKNSNTRQVKVSELIRAGDQEHKNSWEATIPFFGTLRNATWFGERSPVSPKAVMDQYEDMEIEEINCDRAGSFLMFPSVKSKSNEQACPGKIIKDSETKSYGNKYRNPMDETKDTKNSICTENTKFIEKPSYLETKFKMRPLVPSTKKVEKERSFFFWQMLFFLLFPVAILILSISLNQGVFSDETCAHEFDFSDASTDLQRYVYGQAKAIQKLANHFAENSNEFKVVALIGGTGVGKSFAANIIKENFPMKRNIVQYVPPLQPGQRRASEILSLCGCNLIILENLGTNDILDAVNFAESIKMHAESYCVKIVAIFNVQETDDNLKHRLNLSKSSKEIEMAFRKEKLGIDIIEFESLNDEVLNRCIEDAAKDRNVSLSKSQIDYIRHGLLMVDSGCKGAYAKVQLLVQN